MLTQIDVDSENAFYVPILGVTPKDSLLIRSITGLNPPGPNLFIGDYAQDGGTYQGRRVGTRNVVINFDLNPNPALGETVAGLRELLYKAFLDPQVQGDYIKLNLHEDDGRIRYVVGYTEKLETEVFSNEQLVQISIICPDPFLRDVDYTDLQNDTGWSTVPFAYQGTAETGFEAEIYPTVTATQLTIELNGRKMVVYGPFNPEQVIYVNTNRGAHNVLVASKTNVYAWYADNYPTSISEAWAGMDELGQVTSLIAKLEETSPWLELHAQSNVMKVYQDTASDGNFAVRRVRYLGAYWGI